MPRRSPAYAAAFAAALLVAAPSMAADPAAVGQPGGAKGTSPPDARLITLAAPPYERFRAPGVATAPGARTKVRLRLLRTIRHQDWGGDAPFRERNGLTRPLATNAGLPQLLPDDGGRSRLIRLIANGQYQLGIYRGTVDGPYLIGFESASGRRAFSLGFRDWRGRGGQTLEWAHRDRDTLYVAHAYNGYAKQSGGRNAYVSALALPSGRLLWRSRPLVANTVNFVVVRDAIVTGYGFTAEPDYLYVLDRGDGGVAQRIKLRTGPKWIYRKGNRLYVSAYSEYYILAIATR